MNGINAIPRTHNGEGLAYISPEEAIWLRQMGGGVPFNPQTGQLDQTRQSIGPGNIPSFIVGGDTSGMASVGHVGTGSTSSGHGQLGGMGGPGGAPNWVTSGQYRPPVARAAPAVVEEEPEEPNVPTEEEIAERQAKLDARILAGRDRYLAALQSLGYGPPQALYGETSTGEQLFPTGRTIDEIPAWRGLAAGPSGPSIEAGLNTNVTGQTPVNLLERVAAIADQIGLDQGTRTAAHGGLVGRYDLGGLVDSMMLQASRSRENIPSNMVL
jgi:hypothetical protein